MRNYYVGSLFHQSAVCDENRLTVSYFWPYILNIWICNMLAAISMKYSKQGFWQEIKICQNRIHPLQQASYLC
jgi:hypothetical protein